MYFYITKDKNMAFNFVERPEKRKFNYKPQFYQPEEEKTVYKEGEEFDSKKFAEHLHSSWSQHRTSGRDNGNKFPLKTVIWLAFIVFVLVFFFVKFFDK